MGKSVSLTLGKIAFLKMETDKIVQEINEVIDKYSKRKIFIGLKISGYIDSDDIEKLKLDIAFHINRYMLKKATSPN